MRNTIMASRKRVSDYLRVAIFFSIALVVFFPFFRVTVVPEWEISFVSEDGNPVPFVQVDQVWKEHSLEFWKPWEEIEHGLQSDSVGFIRLPARHIRVSVFEVLLSKIRDAIASINPHASSGAHSYIICRGTSKCLVSYNEATNGPKFIIVK